MIYIDTNIFVYAIENHPKYGQACKKILMDVMNKEMLHVQVIRQNITQIYLLAAILSATGEKIQISHGA